MRKSRLGLGVVVTTISLSCLVTNFVQAQIPTSKPATPGPSIYEELLPKKTPPPQKTPGPTVTGQPTISQEGIYLNAVDTDIKDLIKQMSKATGKNFLIGEQVRGKVTIISERKMSVEEAYQAFLSALEVNGFTVVDGPGGLIKIIAIKDISNNALPIFKDESPITDAFITRIVQLKNISALEMSNAIKNLVSKRGNLFAYPATNTLIVTDTGTNIDRLLKIMQELDQEGPHEGLEFIHIRYANAKDIAARITELYTQDKQTKAPTRRGQEFEETPYISKVIADDRTNSVIILASGRAMDKVRALISQLDRPLPDGVEGKIHVHYLKHASAKDLASVLNSLTAGSGQASPQTKTTPGSTAQQKAQSTAPVVASFEGGVKVAADENTNALIITSTAKDYETLRKEVLDRLDIPRRQVYVEAVVMELSINKNRSVGVSGQGGGFFSVNGDRMLGFASTLGGTTQGLSAAALSGLAAGAISDTRVNIPITQSDGTSSNISVPALGVVLNALQTDSDVNVLSTPNLLTLDNEEAEIHVGSEVPVPGQQTITSGGNVTSSPERKPVGITLKIKPQINEGDRVKLTISQEVTDVIAGASETVLTQLGASFSKRSVKTVVVAKDQQTIVIGGLIDDKTQISRSKIPFLGDIPLLGHLFSRRSKVKTKTNLLVFLRPYIIRDTNDFLKILQRKVEERNMFIEQNYGVSHQKVIRNSIRSHAAELLDYKKDIQTQNWEVVPRSQKSSDGGGGEDLSYVEPTPKQKQKRYNRKKYSSSDSTSDLQ